jgi:lipoyl(octanoyl) transferase
MGQNAGVTDRPTAYLYDLLGEPVPYDRATALQLDLAAARSQGAIPDTVILLEHPPTLTIGRSTDLAAELPLGTEGYEALGWDVVTTPRGGRATFHGPGQLVGYPILDLRAHGQDLRRYVHDLERVLVRACGALGVEATTREGADHVGVWAADRKLASLGIRADRWIVTHGFALNVDPDLAWFDRIVPCGIADKGVTSLAGLTGQPIAVEQVIPAVTAAFADVFGRIVVAAAVPLLPRAFR